MRVTVDVAAENSYRKGGPLAAPFPVVTACQPSGILYRYHGRAAMGPSVKVVMGVLGWNFAVSEACMDTAFVKQQSDEW